MKRITLFISAVMLLFTACKPAAETAANGGIPSDDGMFPFVISFTGEDNATDISSIVEAPAGKNGFLRVENGHFVNDKGRVRLNATNLTSSANFPTHEQAERMAARMARLGINCVRLHYMDRPYGNPTFNMPQEPCIFAKDGSERNFDPEMLDRLEYMIYQFKEHGIYINMNLYVARYGYNFLGRNAINPEVQAKEMEFARDFLTHVNPYTKLCLIDDPCLAVVELNNEDAIFTWYMNTSVHRMVTPSGWPTSKELKSDKYTPEQRREYYHKLIKYDTDHWNNMYKFLKNELKLKVPIASSQLHYSQPSTFDGMDYYDMHSYWMHPSGGFYWIMNNVAMVNDPNGGTIQTLASRRYAGKPFTVSEYNHPYPNFYGAEGQPMVHAYAAFHGWDGVFAYSWNNRINEEPEHQEYFFSFTSRTDVLAHFIACAAMFLRGDVAEASEYITPVVPLKAFEEQWIQTPTNSGMVERLIRENTDSTVTGATMLRHKTYVDVHGETPVTFPKEEDNPVKISDTKELEWNNEIPQKGMFIVRTSNVKMFSGFPEGRTVDFGDDMSLKVGKTKLGWTTLSLTSMKGNGFGSGSTTLLAATGYTHNKDAKFTVEKDENGNPTDKISSRFEDWGTAPMMTEGINAAITLASAADATSCWALDPSGNRMTEVPVSKDADGRAVINIDEKYRTIWYEIAVK